MDICEKGEFFIETDDGLSFDYAKIILRDDAGDYFYAKTTQRIFRSPTIDINELDISPIPGDRIYPLADPNLTLAPDPLPSTSYFKRPRLLYYENAADIPGYDCHILTEVKACEILSKHPHPNIAQYLGCIVKAGRIRGLGFAKYPTALSQLLEEKTRFDKSRCLLGVEAGVRHMHELGLVHNDLNPSNIMMDGDRPVIIDFDSCKQEGDELGSKAGTYGWTPDGESRSRRENDLYSLSKLRSALLEECLEC
ncbi:Uu.00g107710.m01.CDS01 [Anthostomella pinea]|uniref:Uu.00g107710.m01.CDS01 n=1 Tax=Anthostomella pinea TaxID=933095 RepID=A0AAI8VEC0_9PEZI|nr:Uu.00g107710.m01.CDS01 [Anthostomella pinea]